MRWCILRELYKSLTSWLGVEPQIRVSSESSCGLLVQLGASRWLMYGTTPLCDLMMSALDAVDISGRKGFFLFLFFLFFSLLGGMDLGFVLNLGFQI